MDRAWIALGSIATVVAIAFGTVNVVELLAHEELTERVTYDSSAIERVDVGNDHGSILVEGGEVDEVTVVAEIDHGLRRTGHRVDLEGTALVVRGSCPAMTTWCRVDYRLVVPRGTDVVAEQSNGRLTIRDVAGEVDVDGRNGRVELDRLAGPVRASSANGSIVGIALRSDDVVADTHNGRVALSFADPPSSVRTSTDNGSIRVVVPDGPETYQVQADTDRGSTDIGIRTDPASDRSITGETHNGSVIVRYPTG